MAKLYRRFKFRLDPNLEQIILIIKTFGCVRFIWNKMLEDIIAYFLITGEYLDRTPAKYKKKHPFLKEVDSMALCNSQMNLRTACKNYQRDEKIGFPAYKSKKRDVASYTTNCINNNIRIEGKHIVLPKLGKVRFKRHREIPDHYKLKAATIIRHASGSYYVSLLYEFEALPITPKPIEKVVGLDFSMPELFVSSDGERPFNPHYYRRSEEKLARMQRVLSHMQPGSKNFSEQKRKIAKVHEHIACQRRDFLHKLSTRIANEYDAVAVESLKMTGMSKALNFGKSVGDNGWGMFIQLLKYKLEEQGKRLIIVDKWFPSSKMCSKCGAIKHDLSLSDRTYVCPCCGHTMDRDLNAAINLKNEAIRILALENLKPNLA